MGRKRALADSIIMPAGDWETIANPTLLRLRSAILSTLLNHRARRVIVVVSRQAAELI